MTLSRRRRHILCVLMVMGLPPAVLAGAWRLGGVSALEDDLIYYLPTRAFIGEAVRSGSWPLWNPFVALGTSVAADPQAGLWYPPGLLFAVLPILWAYPVTLCLHFSLAGGGMYRFLRAMGRDWRAAIFGAVAFEFCGFLVAHRAHLTILEAAAWLPWMSYAWHRFAVMGRRAHFVLAAACLGMQTLVQHMQITLIGGAILTAYVVAILRPLRRSLAWEYPAGLILGGMIGAVQLIPTLAAFTGSGRSAPAYYLFVENSYVPTSFFLWLFPFLFGTRTPNFYDQPWWGWSHLCEQATYTSIGVLLLAVGSLAWWRRDRQVRFWSVAALVSMVLALGQFTPLARVLFHVPILQSFRVPARWVLGLDLAVVVLAAAALDALIRGDADSQPARRWLRLVIRRLLPAAAAACLLCMLLARESAGYLFDERIAAAVAAAIRPGNPAIWVPLVLMAATAIALSNVLRGTPDAPYAARPLPLGILFAVVTVDLASFAGFVDVDMREYPCARALVDPPPLARELLRRSDAPGERLWVPRIRADYARPVEVLWPQLNVLHRIPVLNGYGPMWPAENRALLHFMPWGAAQDALGLLWNPKLLRSLGVRWLAARSEQERELMSLAMAGPPHMDAVRPCGDGGEVALRGRAWRVPVSISTPGVYAVEFRAVPGRRNHDRWYLWLASGSEEKIGDVLWYEPADFIFGPRMVRGFFVCTEAAPGAQLCAYGEPRCEVTLSDVRFGRVADWPPGPPVAGPYRQVAALPDGVVLYELRGARPRYAWADADADGESLTRVIEELQFRPDTASLPADARSQDPATRLGEGAGSIRAVEEDFTHIVLDVFNNSTATLVFNEAFDPGWRASIDGQPARIVRAAAVVQAVRVPAGRHRIEFSYRPVGLSAGLTFSGLGLLATAAYGLLNRRRTPT